MLWSTNHFIRRVLHTLFISHDFVISFSSKNLRYLSALSEQHYSSSAGTANLFVECWISSVTLFTFRDFVLRLRLLLLLRVLLFASGECCIGTTLFTLCDFFKEFRYLSAGEPIRYSSSLFRIQFLSFTHVGRSSSSGNNSLLALMCRKPSTHGVSESSWDFCPF